MVSSWIKDGIAALDSSEEVAVVVPDVGSGSGEGGCSCDCNIAPKTDIFMVFVTKIRSQLQKLLKKHAKPTT